MTKIIKFLICLFIFVQCADQKKYIEKLEREIKKSDEIAAENDYEVCRYAVWSTCYNASCDYSLEKMEEFICNSFLE